MNLTAYSDSESDNEVLPVSKPSAHRLVDRSESRRIKLKLPAAASAPAADEDEDGAPAVKKARTGGGLLSSFNSMLPAPKKSVTTTAAVTRVEKRVPGTGLGVGVNLKTGAEPAFRRESSRVDLNDYDENGNPIKKEPMNKSDFRALLNLPPSKTDTPTDPNQSPLTDIPQQKQEQTPKPAAPRFVPMSVGLDKLKKKKKQPLSTHVAVARPGNDERPTTFLGAGPTLAAETKIAPKPRVPLFSVPQAASLQTSLPQDDHYQLFLTETEETSVVNQDLDVHFNDLVAQQAPTTAAAPNDLTNIASELDLSEAQRRQLFGKGRSGSEWSSANVIEFNTDTEYAHNEKVRQLGEQIHHNPLKSFSGTGKNSLRTLVSQATTQKDALEDHFAAGHRNKREAGNRNGW